MTRRQKWALVGVIVLFGCGGTVAAVVAKRSGAVAKDANGQPLSCVATLALSTATCVLFKNGRAQCYGRAMLLGRPARHPDPDPEPVRTEARFSRIDAGYSNVCGLSRTDGSIWCWGDRTGGGFKEDAPNVPLELEDLGRDNQDLGVAADRVCVLKRDGSVWCQEFLGGPAAKVMVGARSLDMGSHYGCSRMNGGDVYCWGVNQNGELGRGTLNDDGSFAWQPPAPVLPPARSFETLRLGGPTVCGLTKARDVWCWGNNDDGDFADGSYARGEAKLTYLAPKKLDLGLSIRDYVPSCVLTVEGRVWCWGAAACYPTRTPPSESRMPKARSSQSTRAMTTTTLRMFFILGSIGMNELSAQSRTPTTTMTTTMLSSDMSTRSQHDPYQVAGAVRGRFNRR